MGLYNTHGMIADDELISESAEMLGLTPEELTALADHCTKEAWVWQQVRKHKSGQHKRKATLISQHYQRRSRRWKELAAEVERELSEDT